jgi:hypothetical protein
LAWLGFQICFGSMQGMLNDHEHILGHKASHKKFFFIILALISSQAQSSQVSKFRHDQAKLNSSLQNWLALARSGPDVDLDYWFEYLTKSWRFAKNRRFRILFAKKFVYPGNQVIKEN